MWGTGVVGKMRLIRPELMVKCPKEGWVKYLDCKECGFLNYNSISEYCIECDYDE